MLNVTWIAPVVAGLPQLKVLEELGRLGKINDVQIKTATGNVLLDDVSNALDTATDVLIWSGHGKPAGLLLSDTTTVRAKWLALHVARSCRPRVAILAACGSQERDTDLNSFAATLCRAGINVVGFPLMASDVAAGTFIVEGIRSLALGGTVMEAFEVALDAINDDPTAQGVFLTPGMRNTSASVEEELQAIRVELTALRMLVQSICGAPPALSNTGIGNLLAGDALSRTNTAETVLSVRPMTRSMAHHIHGLTGT
jgi:hypothetical protein